MSSNIVLAARNDAIRHMIHSGIRPIDIVAIGIPQGAIERALRTGAWLRLAAKAVRS